ncbi:SAF domain-containing protein [Phytoactinopolyspora limicola]|uniref:SAF domain-containing protein n=1 Tax=Phytoactinopolyspora limicola TaxID=2715536 RepID=UPI00140DF22D|nr:SAF domain-containing protein [Phytoactinopolyspora limicola]
MAAPTTQTSDTVTDRKREREQRGVRGTKAVGATDRLPSPPRQRRPALAALAVLLIVGGATIAAVLAMRADERTPVLMLQHPVEAGQLITEQHLTTAPVAAQDTLLIPSSQLDRVVGQYASVRLREGQLLDTTMLGGSGMLTDGFAAVGAALAVGHFPASGLQPGDVVDLVAVRSDGSGEVISEDVRVSSVTGAGSGSEPVGGGGLAATFIVPSDQRAAVAGAAASNMLAAVLIERGGAIGGED